MLLGCVLVSRTLSLKAMKSLSSNLIPISRLSTSAFRSEMWYTDKHEWVFVSGNQAKIGISKYAADSLGDVVYVALPDPGDHVEQAKECGALESVKAASEVYSPVSGIVSEKNITVEDRPGLVNSSPEEKGWLFIVEMSNREQVQSLLSEEKYLKFLKSQEDDLD